MRLPAPDYLRPARGRPPLAWALAAAAGAALAVASWEALDAWQARQDAQDALSALQASQPARAEAPRDGALDAVRAILDAPWGARIAAIESATPPGLTWLSMELAHDGELQLVGIGSAGTGAFEAAELLRGTRQWATVVVSRVEYDPERRERFEIRASRRDPSR